MIFTVPSSENQGYEKKDIHVFRVISVAAVFIIILVILVLLLSDFFVIEKEKTVYEQTLKPGSVLLEELQAKENQVLTSYALIDSTRGIYQIPIDRAMEVLVQEQRLKIKD